MMLIVALQTGSPEVDTEAMQALDSMQHVKELAYRVIDTDGQATAKWKKVQIDFVAISGTEIARAASHDVG